jgi:diadenylate cyclase
LIEITRIFSRFTWENAADILLVALIFYTLLRLFRGTAAVQLLRGILVLTFVVVLISNMVELTAFRWLVNNSLNVILVAIPVIFQPELRRALERLGRTAPLFGRRASQATTEFLVSELLRTVDTLSERRHGAIIVLEGATGLEEYIETGTRLDSVVSRELLLTIFFPNTALHDGAVIVRGDRILAAGCVLPLTQRQFADTQMGTRHRAAVGITEQNDAIAVVVSEETGIISVSRHGRIVRRLDEKRLRKILQAFYEPRRAAPRDER